MVRGHLWSILGDWLHEFPEIQRALNDTAGKNDRLGHMLRHVAVLEAEVERIIREEGTFHFFSNFLCFFFEDEYYLTFLSCRNCFLFMGESETLSQREKCR